MSDNDSITQLAAEAVVEFDNDMTAATTGFLHKLKKMQPDIYAEKVDRAMFAWGMDLVRAARSGIRDKISRSASSAEVTVKQNEGLGPQSLAASVAAWLDWPINGVPLRLATRLQIREASDRYLQQSKLFQQRGKWLGAVADAMPNDKVRVEKALTADRVAQLAEKYGVTR